MSERDKLRGLLHDWVDGELEPDREAWVRETLERYPDIEEEARAIRRVKQLVLAKYRREPVPPGLRRRVQELLDREQAQGEISGRLKMVSLLAATVLIALVVWVLNPPQDAPTPRVVHAKAVQEAVKSIHQPLPGLIQNAEYVDSLGTQGGTINTNVQAMHELNFKGWKRETFETEDGTSIQVLRLQYEDSEGRMLCCFAFEARLTGSPDDQSLGSRYVKASGAKICQCHRTKDGFTVYCFRVNEEEPLHVVMVIDSVLESRVHAESDGLHTLIQKRVPAPAK